MVRTAGIIGGLGPETTAEFYMKIVNEAIKHGTRPSILIRSVPMSLEDEKRIIIERKNKIRLLELLVESARRLEIAGSDFLAIPCNTAHIFIDEVRSSVSIPVLSIVDETATMVKSQGLAKVGIMATSETIQSGMHRKKLSTKGVSLIEPTQKEQQVTSEIILRILEGKCDEEDRQTLLNIISRMTKKGAQGIVLGCTDLQLLVKQSDTQLKLLDTTEILADAVVREIFQQAQK